MANTVAEVADNLVRNDIHLCVSSLVYGMTQHVHELSRDAQDAIGFTEDDASTLWRREPDANDYRDAAPAGLTVEENEDGWLFDVDVTGPIGGYRSELAAWQAGFDEIGEDAPEGSEIYEHWVVSDWLAGQLLRRGETVARDVLGGLTIWARSTTGQSIAMDAVIQSIARELAA